MTLFEILVLVLLALMVLLLGAIWMSVEALAHQMARTGSELEIAIRNSGKTNGGSDR